MHFQTKDVVLLIDYLLIMKKLGLLWAFLFCMFCESYVVVGAEEQRWQVLIARII